MNRRASLVLGEWLGRGILCTCCMGCTALLDLDGYSVASDTADAGTTQRQALLPDGGASGPGVAVFDHYRFERGQASFAVAAAEGLLANDSGSEVVPGSFATRRGGGVELAADGSFVYTPPGSGGAFWGDDRFEYQVVGEPLASAGVRLTVAAASFDLAGLEQSRAGYTIVAANAFDGVALFYSSAGNAGDVNGDGFEDIVIGVPGPNTDLGGNVQVSPGRGACVVFGKAEATPVSLGQLAGEPPLGFCVVGNGVEDDYDSLGESVAGVGDVNGDGLDDIIVNQLAFDAETPADPNQITPFGRAYVVFGKRDGAPVDPADIRAGRGGGFELIGPSDLRYIGYGVARAGDVNGDGLADVMVSTPYTGLPDGTTAGTGIAYVVFGKVGTDAVQLGTLEDDGGGFEIRGELEGENFGLTLDGIGDINGDGLADVVVEGYFYPTPETLRGRLAVVFGKRDTAPVAIAELADDPGRGFVLYGADDGDGFFDPRPAGDVNGDGFDDLLIGAPLASFGTQGSSAAAVLDAGAGTDAGVSATPDAGPPVNPPYTGVTYVIYGSPNPATMSLRDIEEGQAGGFAVAGPVPNGGLGLTVAAGDVNGDGYSDVLMTTIPTMVSSGAYALLGTASTPTQTLTEAPGRLFPISGAGSDGLGSAAATADVDGDGLDDLILGAIYYPDAPQGAGGFYVTYGWDMSDSLGDRDRAVIGTSDDNMLDLPLSPIIIARGGNGTDTLRLGARQEPLDLRERGRYQSIEVIDARGGGPQLILLDDAALRHIPQNQPGFAFSLSRRLTILGDAEDTLRFDLSGYQSRGGNAGRVVYGREGRYYGLEISREVRIEAP